MPGQENRRYFLKSKKMPHAKGGNRLSKKVLKRKLSIRAKDDMCVRSPHLGHFAAREPEG